MDSQPLLGALVAVTAERRAAEQRLLLEALGANVTHCPLRYTRTLADISALHATTRDLIARPAEVVLLTTTRGVRTWFTLADATGAGSTLRAAFANAVVATRGPRTSGEAAAQGLHVADPARGYTSADMLQLVSDRQQSDVRVAVQVDSAGSEDLLAGLRSLGADPLPIVTYRSEPVAASTAVARLVESIAEQRLDGITFTSGSAFTQLFEFAANAGLADKVRRALCGPVAVASVGPHCAAAGEACGVPSDVIPTRPGLGGMLHALASHLGAPPTVKLAGQRLLLRQVQALVEGQPVELSAREWAVLNVLTRRPEVVVSKATLLTEVWGEEQADEHAVEVTMARLRRRLGTAGAAIQTVTRRGYRLALDAD